MTSIAQVRLLQIGSLQINLSQEGGVEADPREIGTPEVNTFEHCGIEIFSAEKLYKDPHIRAKVDFPVNACWADLNIASDPMEALPLIQEGATACRRAL